MTTSESDREQLQLLSIFHYVVAGLSTLAALLPLVHLFLGWTMIAQGADPTKPDPFATVIGGCFVVVATLVILLGLAFAACLAIAGRNLAQVRGWRFCLVVAAISCVFAPFGTVLGVFTLIVLLRPSVKAAFGVPVAAPEAPLPPPPG